MRSSNTHKMADPLPAFDCVSPETGGNYRPGLLGVHNNRLKEHVSPWHCSPLCLHSLPAPSLFACHHGELPVSMQILETCGVIKGQRDSGHISNYQSLETNKSYLKTLKASEKFYIVTFTSHNIYVCIYIIECISVLFSACF